MSLFLQTYTCMASGVCYVYTESHVMSLESNSAQNFQIHSVAVHNIFNQSVACKLCTLSLVDT